MTTNITMSSPAAFQLKGSLFTLTVLYLLKADPAAITEQLAPLIKQTPKFFQHMPIVLDLHKLSITDAKNVDFVSLIHCLREQGLIPIGVRGGTAEQHVAASSIGLAVLPNTKAEPATETTVKPTPKRPAATPPISSGQPSKVITQPVRSGQQIYARNSDLIVLAPVSAGAELMADGHIHIYGTLRGRALAGVAGNQNARIFCQGLEAELVAIAGHYWVNEDLQKNPLKEGVHIYLENERLQISAL